MKELLIKLDDDVYNDIRNMMNVKLICGSCYGEVDEFVFHIIKFIDKGEKEIYLIKTDKKKGKKDEKDEF